MRICVANLHTCTLRHLHICNLAHGATCTLAHLHTHTGRRGQQRLRSVCLNLMIKRVQRDGQLFIVLSALTDGESLDVATSAGGDRGFESWRKLHKGWGPYTAGRARSLVCENLSPPRAKLHELMGAIERMEDLVRPLR